MFAYLGSCYSVLKVCDFMTVRGLREVLAMIYSSWRQDSKKLLFGLQLPASQHGWWLCQTGNSGSCSPKSKLSNLEKGVGLSVPCLTPLPFMCLTAREKENA